MRNCYTEEEKSRTVPGRGLRYVQGYCKQFSMIARRQGIILRTIESFRWIRNMTGQICMVDSPQLICINNDTKLNIFSQILKYIIDTKTEKKVTRLRARERGIFGKVISETGMFDNGN